MKTMIQCPPLNRITFGQHKSDTNNRMIQLTDVFYVLIRYKWASNFWLQLTADSIIRDPIKRRALWFTLLEMNIILLKLIYNVTSTWKQTHIVNKRSPFVVNLCNIWSVFLMISTYLCDCIELINMDCLIKIFQNGMRHFRYWITINF